jgi:heptosyltransferase-2
MNGQQKSQAFRKDANWREEVERPWAGKVERAGRKILYGLAGAVLSPRAPGPFDFNRVQRLLLIKEPYRMGDLLQTTPTLRALKEWKPSLFIGLLIQDRNLPIFKHNPHVDQLFVYRKKEFNRKPWALLPFLREIRRSRFDLAVTLETQRVHMTNDLLALASGAPFRLRYDGTALGNPQSNVFYNLLSPYAKTEHEVDRNASVFKPYGLKLGRRELLLEVSPSDEEKAKQVLELAFSAKNPQPVLIHPGAYKINNRWPLERYLEIGRRLKEKGIPVGYSIGPSEKEWEEEIRAKGYPVVTGVSILEMSAVLGMCRLVLCNDTGILHLSAGRGTRTLALFGDTYPDQWTPPGGKVKVLQAPDKRLPSISLEEAWAALVQELKLA